MPRGENYYIGVDFGTTNTLVAWGRLHQEGSSLYVVPEIIKIPQDITGSTLDFLPSYVYFASPQNIIIGMGAKEKFLVEAGRVVKSVKRYLGKDYHIVIDNKKFSAIDITSLILKKIRNLAQKRLNTTLRKGVFTVPASFDAIQREEFLAAAALAGWEVDEETLLDEPTASFISFVEQQRRLLPQQHFIDFSTPKNLLIFDFGGGTVDVSIMNVKAGTPHCEIQDLEITPLSISQYTQLGGDDFDFELAKHFLQVFEEENHIKLSNFDIGTQQIVFNRLWLAAENAKLELSNLATQKIEDEGEDADILSLAVDVNILFLVDNFHFSYTLSLKEYLSLMDKFISMDSKDSMFTPITDALRKANLEKDEIDEVLLSGGMSQFPVIQREIAKFFNKKPLQVLNFMTSVVSGAVIYNYYLTEKGKKEVVKPILAESIGIRSYGIKYKKLIPAGTVLPVKKIFHREFITPRDNLREMTIFLYRGDNEDVGKNTLIGIGHITFDTPQPMGKSIDLEISINRNKTLTLVAYLTEEPEKRFTLRIEKCV